ncbi:MAG: glutathione S-transferase family protein [Myxococcota bacterium]
MADAEVIGFPHSSYVWSTRITLAEKGVDYDLVTDIKPGSAEYADQHHPFHKIPAFHHGDVEIFETLAIMHYVDSVFNGPSLVPSNAIATARMNQWMSAASDYLYESAIRGLVIPRLARPETANEEAIRENLPRLRKHLEVFDQALYEDHWLAGDEYSLADIMLTPIIFYVGIVPEGKKALEGLGHLARFAEATQSRPSFAATAPPPPK